MRVSLSNLRVQWNISSHGRTAVAVGVVGGGGVVVSVASASASFLFVWWGFCWCADPSLLDSLRLGRNALSATLRILLLFVAMRAQNGDQRIFFLRMHFPMIKLWAHKNEAAKEPMVKPMIKLWAHSS